MEHSVSRPVLSLALGALVGMIIGFPLSAAAANLGLSAQQPERVASPDSAEAATKSSFQSNVYIVQLEEPPLATYSGGIKKMAATSNRVTGAKKLNTNSKASKEYKRFLKGMQAKRLKQSEAAVGRSLQVTHDFQVVFNGFAVELEAGEADILRAQPGVVSVTRERFEQIQTDVGPEWINAPAIWSGPPNNVAHSRGEGIVVAILDSGINSDHPSFADIGGDGYDHTNPLGSGNYIPGSHCDVTDPGFCNDKLIGAWDFTGPADGVTPEDENGHGSHVAGTAAGNVVESATLFAPTTEFTRDITGVAPHANIIAYDVCIQRSCPGSALLAAINQVVIDAAALPDGIHALNYSISGGGDPWNDIIEIGFLNASAAGVYVAASAGNSGPGPSTNGHNGPWVSTTAALTHNRRIDNTLVDLGSDGDGLPDITGAGLTSGYGPAPIIYAADAGDAQCLNPFPPGTFNGEIVVCDRGSIARVDKGANVLAGGAGGFVLANIDAQGEAIVADAHFLPGVHIGDSAGDALRDWLAANTGTMATISGYSVNLDAANGDVMAGFSSRGPNTIDVIKPDIGGPGVSVFAAEADGQAPAPEYQFLSGTSMSSPHNAGAGALLSGVQPAWTPYQIRSALMMSAERNSTLKEDGSTPTDPFDIGAGRVDLTRAQEVGIVLDETPANFLAANPDLGGEPKTLNLASMQDGACVGSCTFTRTVENVMKNTGRWDLSSETSDNISISTSPGRKLKVKKGETRDITVTVDTTVANPGWNFGSLELERKGDGPDLHMPIAVFATDTSNADLLSKTVDLTEATPGTILSYEIGITNGQLVGLIDLSDVLPPGLSYVNGSATEVVTNGITTQPFSFAGGALSWQGQLDVGGLNLTPSPSPFGFFPLASLGVAPFGCPSNCDDGSFTLNVPAFMYNGQSYSQVIWSVNGAIEAGSASGIAASATNQNLPSGLLPNNLMAPLWTDLNLGAGGQWYVAVLNAGPRQFTVYEWNDVPLFGDNTTRYSFQVWVENGPSGNIWFVYAQIGSTTPPSGMTVGVENDTGTVGSSYYFEGVGTAPVVGADLQVDVTIGGTATFTFQAEATDCPAGDAIVNRADVTTATTADTAIAVTRCVAE